MTSTVKTKTEYENIKLFLLDRGTEVVMEKESKKRLKKKAQNFILFNNVLYLKDEEGNHKRVFCDEEAEVMEMECKTFHQGHHLGMHKFEYECNKVYFKFPRQLIRKVVSECIVCGQSQPLKKTDKQVHITAQCPLERLMIDLIDVSRYEKTNCGYKWLLTVIDVHSKYSWVFPLKTKTGKEVVEKLEDLFYLYTGPPKIIQCDNGKEFCNSHMLQMAEEFKIVLKHSRPRHPQANGQIERFNQTLTRYLQRHIFEDELVTGVLDEKKWTRHLSKVVYLYNGSVHSATKATPFRLLLRRPGFNTVAMDLPDRDDEELNELEEDDTDISLAINTSSIDSKYLARMDRHSLVHVSKYSFQVGDVVLISLDFDNNVKTKKKKFSSFWSNPVTIIEILPYNRAKVFNGSEEEIVEFKRLKYETVYLFIVEDSGDSSICFHG
jgi:transposase InsO family protein